jgi:putative ABC transport system permease protein
LSGTFNVGPRLLISRDGLERTGLITLGSRASRRLLFRLGPTTPPIAVVQAELKQAFPEAMIVDFREVNPNIARGLVRATTFLSLVSLIAVIIGAIGVATAMRAHLQTRLDSIAIIKSIGGRSGQIVQLYLLQTILLGLAGGAIGVAVGLGVEAIFPVLIERYFQLRPDIAFNPVAAMQGMLVGLLTTVLFTLPPLLSIREVRPAAIFRRDMPETRLPWKQRARRSTRALVTGLLILIALASVTGALVANSWEEALRIGMYFIGGLAASLLVLTATAWLLLKALQTLVERLPRLPVTARHAVSNLYRPGSQSRAVLTALGVGVMFTVTIHLVQSSVLGEIRRNAPPGMANVFFLDITPQQKDEFVALVSGRPGVARPPDVLANVSCRLAAVNGVPADQLNLTGGAARRYRMARSISTEANLPEGAEIVRGAWWTNKAPGQISINEFAARTLHLEPGSAVTWSAYGRTIETRVAAIHRTDPQRIRGMVEFYASPGTLDGLPTVHYGAARVKPESIGALQRAIYQRFPTITVINVADILDRIQEVVDQISVVIRFISAFAIFAGAVILSSSVAGTRFRRMREMAVFKTLGATRARIARMLSAEFLILGTVAGVVGSLLANAFTWLVLRRFFDEVPFRIDWLVLLVSVISTALIAAASGWLASFPILGQKPLEVLRGE